MTIRPGFVEADKNGIVAAIVCGRAQGLHSFNTDLGWRRLCLEDLHHIGDEIGQHLEYNDILMPDFLTKQMVNRIRFKFTQSDFPPQENYEEAVIGVIADTARYYHFKDFKEVHTDDIRTHKKMIFVPKQLDFFGEDKPKNEDQKQSGKLIHIIFENGKTTIKEQ